VTSKSEAVRLIRQGGLYLNDARVTDEKARIAAEHAIGGRVVVLRKGPARASADTGTTDQPSASETRATTCHSRTPTG
jgi:tyrosyl-tRNA synthetase